MTRVNGDLEPVTWHAHGRNEINSAEQMVQAFQWAGETAGRLKAVWFTDCAQVFCGASLGVPENKGLPRWTRFTSVAQLMFN